MLPMHHKPTRRSEEGVLGSTVRMGEVAIDLDRIRWKGEESFRMLSCYFSVRWNFGEAEEMVRRTLGHFIVERDPDECTFYAMPGMPPQYSIVKRRTPIGKFHLVVEDKLSP